MPRANRTYSDTDVLRIIQRHLTKEEGDNVVEALCGVKVERDIFTIERVIEEGTFFLVALLLARIPPLRIPIIRRFLTRTSKRIIKKTVNLLVAPKK